MTKHLKNKYNKNKVIKVHEAAHNNRNRGTKNYQSNTTITNEKIGETILYYPCTILTCMPHNLAHI